MDLVFRFSRYCHGRDIVDNMTTILTNTFFHGEEVLVVAVVYGHIRYLPRQLFLHLILIPHSTRFSPNATIHRLLRVGKGEKKIQLLR
jgi:hypothetical protein